MAVFLPSILNVPPKMLPFITDFNKYTYFLLVGGRVSTKSHSAARLILYIGEKRKVRVLCGREIQNNIEESVHALLGDLIEEFQLNYDVRQKYIKHRDTGSKIRFKGFREQGRVNIKGVEGVDILWIDEAQSISKPVLDYLIPTIARKSNMKAIFTMNRHLRDDPVYETLAGRPDCLLIEINFTDNPFVSLETKVEAEICRQRSQKDYEHTWLGVPLQSADDYLFNYDKLHAATSIVAMGELYAPQRVMSIDFAAQGADHNCVSIIDRKSGEHWKLEKQILWDEDDTMVSIGKIVNLIGEYKPTMTIIDIGGMGKVVYDRLIELKIKNLFPFDGGSTQGVDKQYTRKRVEGYYLVKIMMDSGHLIIDKELKEVIKQLEKIKMKFLSSGVRDLEKKTDMKKVTGYSPDNADSLMMGIWAIHKLLAQVAIDKRGSLDNNNRIKRVNKSKRHM